MSTIIKSCSPGTKCDYVLNDQGMLCFLKVNELQKFVDDQDARSLNDIGAYIIYEPGMATYTQSYSGESSTEDSGGVLDRLKEHKLNKPVLTHAMVLFNATVDGHRRYDGNTFKVFEHLFKMMLVYADKTRVLNIKRTGGNVSPEMYQKVICPTLVEIKYRTEGVLSYILTPNNDLPAKPVGGKGFIKNNEDDVQVYLKDSVILKHSHFKFPHKKIRESNDCFTLLNSLINAGLCIPYVHGSEVVMKFITDTDLNVPHVINGSQKKDFFINERTLVSLMGSDVEFRSSFK